MPPITTALLVIDVQNFFLFATQRALPHIQTLISHFRAHKLPILFTQHGHSPSDLVIPSPNPLVNKWGVDGSIRIGTTEWELQPEIAKVVEETRREDDGGGGGGGARVSYGRKGKAGGWDGAEWPVIAKDSYDAFVRTTLEEQLRERGVRRVVLCGTLTDCCVDTTAKGTFNRGFETLIAREACGAAGEREGKESLRVFERYYGDVVGVDEVLELVKGEGQELRV